jgi:phosphoribosylformylglycinamidine cyclo-ligase
MGWTYLQAGVNIDAKKRLIEAVTPHLRRTYRPQVVGDIGRFAGLFTMKGLPYREPVLVASTDGVGTKVKIAAATGKHASIGIDLVAMCANDVAVMGADPLFFLDYLATGHLDTAVAAEVIRGIARGCEEAGCALIAGETAEMPEVYPEAVYDLAGFCVGVAERCEILDGSAVRAGDALVGVASSGLHCNGFSLVRRILEVCLGLSYFDAPQALGAPLGEILLTPTRIYVRALRELRARGCLRAAAHVTGGGWLENIPRILPEGLGVRVRLGSWPVPPIFRFLQQGGDVSEEEMFHTFNMGIGLACVVPGGEVQAALGCLREIGESAFLVGEVVPPRGSRVHFVEA